MAIADTANLVVQLRLDDKLSGGLGRVNTQLKGLQAGVGQMGRGVGQLGAGLARIGTIAATGFAVGVGTALKVAGDFEAQLNTINTLAKLQGPQLTALGDGIRQTFRDTGVPLDELTSGYYDLLSAGIKLTDAQNALNLSVKLGVAGLGTTQEAVNLVTTAINTFRLDQQGAADAADIFAQTVADGVIKVSELQGAFADVAPIANTAGVSIKEIGASFAVLTAKGTLAAEAGTQLNRAILELYKPTGDLAKIQDKLGGSFRDLIKSRGLVQTLEDIRIEAAKNGQTFFDLFGRIEGAKAATNLTGDAFADFTLEMQRMDGAAGELNEQFGERQKGLNFQLGRLKAAAENAGIIIGNALLPKLVPLVEQLNEFLEKNQGKIAEFGQKLADGLGSFADRLQGIDFSGVIGGLKILGDVGKKVVDIFLSLPKGVQGALVAGFAINKLSGGLIGSGASNIAGGAIKILFDRFGARGSGPQNPLWVQSVGGGVGGVPGVGGKPGFNPLLGALAVGGGIGIGAAIGKPIYDKTVAPAVTFEQSQFSQLLKSNDIADLSHGLDAINGGIDQLGGDNFYTHILFGEQLDVLLSQRDILQDRLGQLVMDNNLERAHAAERQAVQSSDAARMLDQLRSQTTGINQIAAKNPVIYTNVKLTSNVSVSVSNVVRTITSYTAALGSGPGGAVSNPY